MRSKIIAAAGFILLFIGGAFLGSLVQDLIIELRFRDHTWQLAAAHILFDFALMLILGGTGEFLMREHMNRKTVRIIIALLGAIFVLGGIAAGTRT
jgi:hypothetical protein